MAGWSGGLTYFCMFIPIWGNDPIWLIFFRWVGEKPPTRWQLCIPKFNTGFEVQVESTKRPGFRVGFQGTRVCFISLGPGLSEMLMKKILTGSFIFAIEHISFRIFHIMG